MSEVSMHVDMDLHDIACSLSSLPYEEILEFVEQLDSHVADWDFTTLCYEYFCKEMEQNRKEEFTITSDEAYVTWNDLFEKVFNLNYTYNLLDAIGNIN